MDVSGPSCLSLVELGRFSWVGFSNHRIFASIFGLFSGFELWLGVGDFSRVSLFLVIMLSKILMRFLVLGTIEVRPLDLDLFLLKAGVWQKFSLF